jgi:hypothetical protein
LSHHQISPEFILKIQEFIEFSNNWRFDLLDAQISKKIHLRVHRTDFFGFPCNFGYDAAGQIPGMNPENLQFLMVPGLQQVFLHLCDISLTYPAFRLVIFYIEFIIEAENHEKPEK